MHTSAGTSVRMCALMYDCALGSSYKVNVTVKDDSERPKRRLECGRACVCRYFCEDALLLYDRATGSSYKVALFFF